MSTYALIENGKVVNTIIWDGEGHDFGEGITAVIVPDGTSASVGWTYSKGKFTPPPVSEEDAEALLALKLANNINTKAVLIAEATQMRDTLQDAVDLDEATDEEAAALILWKKYRVLLNRIDTETSDDIDWPVKPS